MKKTALFLLLVSAVTCMLNADPLLLQRAGNYNSAGTVEVGLEEISYQNDITKFESTDIETNLTVSAVPFFIRYSVTDSIETEVTVPYVLTQAETSGGGSTSSEDVSGLGNSEAMLKYSSDLENAIIGVSIITGIHTGGDDFSQGLDIYPSLLIRREFDTLSVNINAGYKITGEYDDPSNSDTVNPGDIIKTGLGLEYPLKNIFSFSGEFLFDILGKSEVNGIKQNSTNGTRQALVVGGRYNKGNIRTKLGVDISFGNETYRNYDYRVFAGITYKI